MGEHVVCGVDAHEKWLDCRIGVDREAPGRRRYENNREGRGELFEQLQVLAEEHGGAKVMVGYEASLLGFGLYDDCREQGFECAVLAPTKIARSVEDRKRKTDDRDATRIFEALRAHVLAGNALPAIWIPDVETRDDREMLRARLDLSETAVAGEDAGEDAAEAEWGREAQGSRGPVDDPVPGVGGGS